MLITPPHRVLQPWEANPRELVSWLDMLQISAYMFMYCGRALREIKKDCLVASISDTDHDIPIFHLAAPVDQSARDGSVKQLVHVEREFRQIGLTITADMTNELIEALKDSSRPIQNYQWLMNEITTIEKLSDKELNGKLFLYIPVERARFWPTTREPHLFGEEVANKFPSAEFDINNGGVCLATMMSTAAVFHLMRVLEIGLAALGNVFGISLAHTNWEPAIRQIESRIRDMHIDPTWKAKPDCKELQEFYAQAASHFAMFKDAWRNYTMHTRAKYTENEAESIFLSVKAFMQKLATKVGEI